MNKEDDFMCDYDNAIFRLATAQEAEPEDYIGEDGDHPQQHDPHPQEPDLYHRPSYADQRGDQRFAG